MKMPKKKIVNLCDHPINIGEVEIAPSGRVARVTVQRTPIRVLQAVTEAGEDFDVQLNQTCAILGSGLPDPTEDTLYIVSRQVAEVANGRDDLLIVDETVKGSNGRVKGAQSLAQLRRHKA